MPADIYGLAIRFFGFILHIFFSSITSRGSHLVPEEGPVVLVGGLHSNQFVDPMVILKTCARRVHFLIAKKSHDRKLVGQFSRALQAIPVPRAQDYVTKANGLVYAEKDSTHTIRGKDTAFRQLKFGEKTMIIVNQVHMQVSKIISDTELTLLKPIPPDVLSEEGIAFQIAPAFDNNEVYHQVHQYLHDGKVVGIFPEGGSHDQPEMLPLKAGVTLMVLGALAENPNLNVKIVPVGLYYYNPARFRSRAVVEYGPPITIAPEMVEEYKMGGIHKRKACSELLETIRMALRGVTVNAPNSESLSVIQTAKRLYKSSSKNIDDVKNIELTRKFAEGYNQLKDQSAVRALIPRILYYNEMLEIFGLRDHQVEDTTSRRQHLPISIPMLIRKALLLVVVGLIFIVSVLINLPIIVVARSYSRKKAKEALAASSVKITGKDVVATWKLMVALVLIPTTYITYSTTSALLAYLYYDYKLYDAAKVFCYVMLSIISISYVGIRTGETIKDNYKSIKPLFISLLQMKVSAYEELVVMRAELRRSVIQLVESLAPTLFPDFDSNRIVTDAVCNRLETIENSSGVRRRAHVLQRRHSAQHGSASSMSTDDPLNWDDVDVDEQADDIYFFSRAASENNNGLPSPAVAGTPHLSPSIEATQSSFWPDDPHYNTHS